jgi:hypothetical protein
MTIDILLEPGYMPFNGHSWWFRTSPPGDCIKITGKCAKGGKKYYFEDYVLSGNACRSLQMCIDRLKAI